MIKKCHRKTRLYVDKYKQNMFPRERWRTKGGLSAFQLQLDVKYTGRGPVRLTQVCEQRGISLSKQTRSNDEESPSFVVIVASFTHGHLNKHSNVCITSLNRHQNELKMPFSTFLQCHRHTTLPYVFF